MGTALLNEPLIPGLDADSPTDVVCGGFEHGKSLSDIYLPSF